MFNYTVKTNQMAGGPAESVTKIRQLGEVFSEFRRDVDNLGVEEITVSNATGQTVLYFSARAAMHKVAEP